MDSASGMAGMELNLRVLKEPRGFIRLVQFILSIFAFSTICGYSGYVKFNVDCADNITESGKISFSYPFSESKFISNDVCSKSIPQLNFSSSAEFFVASGVLSFLYTLAVVLFYIFANRLYGENQLAPVVDLGVSGILTIFWFAGSCAWANALVDIKSYTSFDQLKVTEFKAFCSEGSCKSVFSGNFASLNVSVIFGFANVILWAGSLWFIYKETAWHQSRQQSNAQQGNANQQDPHDYTLPH